MAEIKGLDPRGLNEDSQTLLRTFIDTPEEQQAAEKYMAETNKLIEAPLESQKQQVQEGYAGVTKSKEELKRRTELQELIDLAVKGAVKAYAGYEGSRTGLDLSKTSIETPDRSAAYARGLEIIRGTQEEVQLKERNLFKDLQTRERRLGEFRSAAERARSEEARKKEKADEHYWRLQEKKEREAKENEAEKKLKYTAFTQLTNRDITNIDKSLESTANLSGPLEGDDFAQEAKAVTNLELRAKEAKISDNDVKEMLAKKEYSKLQMTIIDRLRGIKSIKQEQQKLFNNLSMTGRAATESENKALAVFELLTEVPALVVTRDASLPAGQVQFDITRPSLDTTDSTDFQKYDAEYQRLYTRMKQLPETDRKSFRERVKLDEKGSIRQYWSDIIANKGPPKDFQQLLESRRLNTPMIREEPIVKDIDSLHDLIMFQQEQALKKRKAQPMKIGVKY